MRSYVSALQVTSGGGSTEAWCLSKGSNTTEISEKLLSYNFK